MDNKDEIYDLAARHQAMQQKWNDEIVAGVLSEMQRKGYVNPACYILYYDHKKGEYINNIVQIESEDLKDVKLKEKHLHTLRNIDKTLPDPAIALMFVSEGSVPIEGSDDRMYFLLITFETRIDGWKSIYRVRKRSWVGEGGITTTVLEQLEFDELASKNTSMPEVEKFAHILRTNMTDKTSEIYN